MRHVLSPALCSCSPVPFCIKHEVEEVVVSPIKPSSAQPRIKQNCPMNRLYLNVPYREKDAAKALDA